MEDIKRIAFENKKLPASHFDLVRLREVLDIEYLDHDPTALHRVDFFVLMIITAGEGKHTIDFTDYDYQRGTVLTIRKGQIHKFFRSPQTAGTLIVFTEEFILGFLRDNDALRSLQLFNETISSPKLVLDENSFEDIIHLVRYVQTEYADFRDHYSAGILRSLLHILLTKLYRFKSRENELELKRRYLSEFIEFQELVEQQCFQTRKVKDYANALGFSSKKLNMVVQSIAQKSAKIFIDEILILKIKRLLINSPLSAKEIAYKVGFEEPSNLFKFFKRYTQSTPEGFRQIFD
ncbi:MAG: helix-turn-helix transcriptional regulator [Bacteroidota bacterium]